MASSLLGLGISRAIAFIVNSPPTKTPVKSTGGGNGGVPRSPYNTSNPPYDPMSRNTPPHGSKPSQQQQQQQQSSPYHTSQSSSSTHQRTSSSLSSSPSTQTSFLPPPLHNTPSSLPQHTQPFTSHPTSANTGPSNHHHHSNNHHLLPDNGGPGPSHGPSHGPGHGMGGMWEESKEKRSRSLSEGTSNALAATPIHPPYFVNLNIKFNSNQQFKTHMLYLDRYPTLF